MVEMNALDKLDRCRICESRALEVALDLGDVALSGVFPESEATNPPLFPLTVLRCESCGLGQLEKSPPLAEMYGENYGYRSGLNGSMVSHLKKTVGLLQEILGSGLNERDVVLDIGSNDGTLLSAIDFAGTKVGIDPTISKFKSYYADTDVTVSDFFSAGNYWQASQKPAKLITSIAMFYDLPNPTGFCSDIADVLDQEGIWHVEFSYTPWVMDSVAYDTVCHEHLLYLTVTQVKLILDQVGLKIIRVALNRTNGGSVALTVAHRSSRFTEDAEGVSFFLQKEENSKRYGAEGWSRFADAIVRRQRVLKDLLEDLNSRGKRVAALGASTKGNVLLQTSKIGPDLVESVGEVNEDKIGKFLPGSLIPIVAEDDLLRSRPDFLLLLPWHFREGFEEKLSGAVTKGTRLIVPLPDVEIIG